MYKILETLEIFFHTNNDAPEPWGLFFQDNATPQMEGLEELHNNIMFYLAIIPFCSKLNNAFNNIKLSKSLFI